MSEVTIDERTQVIRELQEAADDFAERALGQEVRRDGARPGTGSHHQFAHSATLWRSAERRLRARIEELELGSATRLVPVEVSAKGHPASAPAARCTVA